MMVLYDPIHGVIQIKPFEEEIIYTPTFSRLAKIRQLDFAYLRYPDANHTRFEHSLGVFHLSSIIDCRKLGITENVNELRAAALLHDIGHGPFSHLYEEISERTGSDFNHVNAAIECIQSEKDTLQRLTSRRVNFDLVIDILRGKPEVNLLSKIISGTLDVDRLDYLKRDLTYTGISPHLLNLHLLIKSFESHDHGGRHDLVVRWESISAIELLLHARILERSYIHFAPERRAACCLIYYAMDKTKSDLKEAARLDDHGFLRWLEKKGATEEFNILQSGVLYDDHQSISWESISPFLKREIDKLHSKNQPLRELTKFSNKMRGEIESDVCKTPNLSVLVDIPEIIRFEEIDTIVVKNGKPYLLKDISPIAKVLSETYETYWSISVFMKAKEGRIDRSQLNKIKKNVCEYFANY